MWSSFSNRNSCKTRAFRGGGDRVFSVTSKIEAPLTLSVNLHTITEIVISLNFALYVSLFYDHLTKEPRLLGFTHGQFSLPFISLGDWLFISLCYTVLYQLTPKSHLTVTIMAYYQCPVNPLKCCQPIWMTIPCYLSLQGPRSWTCTLHKIH